MPTSENTERIVIYVDPATLDDVDEARDRAGLTRTAWARQAMKEKISRERRGQRED
jgi:hypothetical protein